MIKRKIRRKECKCGCGQFPEKSKVANRWNKFVNGHNRRKKFCILKLCECGCGKYIKGNKRFAVGHAMRDRKHTKETKLKIGNGNRGGKGNLGYRHTEEHKRWLSESRKGVNNPMFGKTFKLSKEAKLKISKANSGSNNGMFGKNYVCSDDIKIKISLANSGSNNGMFGDKNPNWYGPDESRICPVCEEKFIVRPQSKQVTCSYFCKSIFYSGPNSHAWRGGISMEPYCYEFTDELKQIIKERDNYECQNPECNHVTDDLPFHIHHVDYNKKHCYFSNLITLCKSCNSRANANRGYWEALYKNIMKGII